MQQQITLERASGNYTRDLVKIEEMKIYNLVIYKNVEPIWGGLYAVALITKQGYEVKTKNGLCLDAAIEVYNATNKHLTK